MTSEIWQIESEKFLPSKMVSDKEFLRRKYISCLQEMIAKLREKSIYLAAISRTESREEESPTYTLPTIIFAEYINEPASDYVSIRMTCYRNRGVFKELLEQEERYEGED